MGEKALQGATASLAALAYRPPRGESPGGPRPAWRLRMPQASRWRHHLSRRPRCRRGMGGEAPQHRARSADCARKRPTAHIRRNKRGWIRGEPPMQKKVSALRPSARRQALPAPRGAPAIRKTDAYLAEHILSAEIALPKSSGDGECACKYISLLIAARYIFEVNATNSVYGS